MTETQTNWWKAHVMEENSDGYDGWLKGKRGNVTGQKRQAMVLTWKGENLNSITGSSARPFGLGSAFLWNKKQPRTQINNVLPQHPLNKHLTLWRQNSANQHPQNLCSRSHERQDRGKKFTQENKNTKQPASPKEIKCFYYSCIY